MTAPILESGTRVQIQAKSGPTIRLWIWLALSCGWALITCAETDPGKPVEPAVSGPYFRVGFSSELFGDMLENDAKAAVKVWGRTAIRESGLPIDPEPVLLNTPLEMMAALRENRIDALGMSAPDWLALRESVHLDPILVTYNSRSFTENYVVLTHSGSGFTNLASLKGRSLLVYKNARTCLATTWLEVMLGRSHLPKKSAFFRKITEFSKASKAILPVFFHQADACLTTESSLVIMAELNPQLGNDLQVIAKSEAYVPGLFGFRTNYDAKLRDGLRLALRDLDKTPAGQQVLAIFQSEKVEESPESCLDSVLRLMREHDLWATRTNPAPNR